MDVVVGGGADHTAALIDDAERAPALSRAGRRRGGGARGLSPRGRGNLHDQHADDVGAGSIPAWAGKPAR